MEYSPSLILKNGHINTIFPTLFRRQKTPDYSRQRLVTSDDDFLDLDCLFNNNKRLTILCHGLEGSSLSNYMIGTARLLQKNDWDVMAMNFRSCSGEMNRQIKMYHSGATYDLDEVIQEYFPLYSEIVLVGFSLGGNVILKYAGEQGIDINPKIKAVVGISVPVDLEAGSINIGKPSNFIYENKFLKALLEKITFKAKKYPSQIDAELINQVKTLYDFDDFFTGPIHGFENAKDYYTKCSSKQFIKAIHLPSRIINAIDDPFLPEECYPYKEVENHRYVELITPRYGGHVGFVELGKEFYWSEKMILSFINSHSDLE